MDDLGNVLGGLTGGGDIAGAIRGLVGGEGGLSGLIDTLGKGGLDDVATSWVSSGGNKAVDPAQLGAALGDDKVNELAQKSGLPVGALLPLLASALPAIIDALTPDGKVPQGDAAKGFDIGGLLQGLSDAANAGPSSPLAGLGKLLSGT
ncbi:MAG TPA: YidB family protein [Candidatus Limnocylindrales bacterium]|nr:YidB family protein [Candidatus Limnocylindrales bacterium]